MASRGPLNYTTSVEPDKSAIECIGILTKHGATHAGLAIGEDRMPDGIEFVIRTQFGPRQYSLDVDAAGAQKVLMKAWRDCKIERRYTEPVQARRVAWRVMKDWLEAQMALVEIGLRDLPQVMLPYMKVDGNHTLYGAWLEREQLALETGQGPAGE